MIRATVDDSERINDWIWRDSGKRGDISSFLADRNNVCLIEGEGGAIFVWRGPGIFEVHVFFEQRGKAAIALSHEMLDWMRARGARLFWAAVPIESSSRRVIMFTRLMGWDSQGFGDFPQGRCEIFEGK